MKKRKIRNQEFQGHTNHFIVMTRIQSSAFECWPFLPSNPSFGTRNTLARVHGSEINLIHRTSHFSWHCILTAAEYKISNKWKLFLNMIWNRCLLCLFTSHNYYEGLSRRFYSELDITKNNTTSSLQYYHKKKKHAWIILVFISRRFAAYSLHMCTYTCTV